MSNSPMCYTGWNAGYFLVEDMQTPPPPLFKKNRFLIFGPKWAQCSETNEKKN